jgi:hypothetical protein
LLQPVNSDGRRSEGVGRLLIALLTFANRQYQAMSAIRGCFMFSETMMLMLMLKPMSEQRANESS